MPELQIGAIQIQTAAGENMLDALLAAGQKVPWSCRAGHCQTCIVQALSGQPPPQAEAGLSPDQRQAGWLLACQCPVQQDMQLKLHDPAVDGIAARIVELHPVTDQILVLRLKPERPMRFQPGQHAVLWLDSELARPYSIASQPGDPLLTFHLRLHQSGAFSDRIQRLTPGHIVYLGTAGGHMHYDPDWQDKPLLLLAAGTGLAPLQAIARHALESGHQAPIELRHWHDEPVCYLEQPLLELAASHPQLTLRLQPRTELAADLTQMRLASRATLALVCGPPTFVELLRKPLYMAGLPGRQIIDEAFLSRRA
jgi:ferredoxin-NADP reductase/ferredoxin